MTLAKDAKEEDQKSFLCGLCGLGAMREDWIKDDSPLWNSAWGEQRDLGRVGILRGKGRKVWRRGEDWRKDNSPCGIALRENNSILVEEIFHGASPVK